jgi:hypothetical protein
MYTGKKDFKIKNADTFVVVFYFKNKTTSGIPF